MKHTKTYLLASATALLFAAGTYTAQAQTAQGVSITPNGPSEPHESAMLHVKGTDKGVLVPRLTTTNRDNITTLQNADGLLIYVTDGGDTERGFQWYDESATEWKRLGEGDALWSPGTSGEIYQDQQSVAIGSQEADPAAILDMSGATNQGVLMPRISLQDISPVMLDMANGGVPDLDGSGNTTANTNYFEPAATADGLMVYVNDVQKGLYFWDHDGSTGSWRKVGPKEDEAWKEIGTSGASMANGEPIPAYESTLVGDATGMMALSVKKDVNGQVQIAGRFTVGSGYASSVPSADVIFVIPDGYEPALAGGYGSVYQVTAVGHPRSVVWLIQYSGKYYLSSIDSLVAGESYYVEIQYQSTLD